MEIFEKFKLMNFLKISLFEKIKKINEFVLIFLFIYFLFSFSEYEYNMFYKGYF